MQTDLITNTEVLETFKKMKPSNVCGEDDISINMIKDTADILLLVLTKICSLSWNQGVCPNTWKSAIVLLLFKGDGPKEIPKSYRPIALPARFWKV